LVGTNNGDGTNGEYGDRSGQRGEHLDENGKTVAATKAKFNAAIAQKANRCAY
jgi:cell division protein FtsI/penicillin-binding protein 2